jgi:phospholipid/cholesterol/gamma-HCH transport system substrate-binding protein
MEESRRLSLMVGAFALAALAVGAFLLFNLGSSTGLLQPRYQLITYFEDVQGLVAGAPVRLAGKDVGRVDSVSFAPLSAERPPVQVVMQIDSDVQDRIRNDSVATIGTIGLLGDKYVSLQPGTEAGVVLADGEEVASVSPLDLNVAVVRGTEAIDNIATLAENANRLVSGVADSMVGQNLGEAARGLSEVVAEVREGDGLLHSLIYDEYEGKGVESVEHSLATLDGILNEIATGDGTLHQLIYDPAPERNVVEVATDAGLKLDSVLGKIDAGEGTLGLLVNDPSLYGDLKDLVGGARRSLAVQALIRLSGGEGGEE